MYASFIFFGYLSWKNKNLTPQFNFAMVLFETPFLKILLPNKYLIYISLNCIKSTEVN